MIRVFLHGRTGNNLFQYAVGRFLALHHNTQLILDGSWEHVSENQLSEVFKFPLVAKYENSWRFLKRTFLRLGARPETWYRGYFHQERKFGFDPTVPILPDGSILYGYFQSARYFESITTSLRSELDLSRLQIPKESLIFESILREPTTVSIHVRRGDYLRIANTQCLNENYHKEAIRYFRERLPFPRFCIFSDDIPWCRNQFKGADFLFCDLPGSKISPLHDMRLMSSCRHHVIVNSSYSWWGAWLNPSEDKMVIAPKMWMKDLPITELLLPSWVSI